MRNKKRLKDTLPLFKPGEPGLPKWLKEEFEEPKTASISVTLAGPRTVETSLQPVRAKASDIGKLQALRFVDLLKLGHKPGEVAHRMHTTVQEMMNNPDCRKMVERLVKEYTLDGQETKSLIRALRVKTMLGDDPKLALDAAKQAAEDPDVGLVPTAAPTHVDVTLRALLTQPVEPLPGFPKQLGEVIDTTVVEEEKK